MPICIPPLAGIESLIVFIIIALIAGGEQLMKAIGNKADKNKEKRPRRSTRRQKRARILTEEPVVIHTQTDLASPPRLEPEIRENAMTRTTADEDSGTQYQIDEEIAELLDDVDPEAAQDLIAQEQRQRKHEEQTRQAYDIDAHAGDFQVIKPQHLRNNQNLKRFIAAREVLDRPRCFDI